MQPQHMYYKTSLLQKLNIFCYVNIIYQFHIHDQIQLFKFNADEIA